MSIGKGPITMTLNINNNHTRGMIDSGASRSVIDIGTLEALGMHHKIVKTENIELVDASNNKMNIIGSCEMDIFVPKINQSYKQVFNMLNVKTCKTLLLGRDFLAKIGPVTIDVPKKKIKICKTWINCEAPKSSYRVNTGKTFVLPARSEQTIFVSSKADSSMLDFELIPKITGAKGVYTTHAKVQPDANGQFMMSIFNINEYDITLNARTKIGEIYTCNDEVQEVSDTLPDKKEVLKKVKFGKNLDVKQKQEMMSIINDHADLFAHNPKKPSVTSIIEHSIETGEARPTFSKTRRIPNAWKEEVEENVQEMLNNGIIRPSKSPWNCPIILVRKGGKTRFVCDYRDVNKETKRDTYPLPNIKDCIEKMEGTKYWSTLDAPSAYWSVNMKESDREKTAFSVPNGKYEFNVMPYGLRNAGATYQRMMDISLSGLPTDRILAYLDDVIIFNKTYEEHLSDLKKVFERLRVSNISLRPEKCLFGSNEVDFLGYNLSEEGIKPKTELVEAILDFKQPRTAKEVKRFLGTVGFYGNFIDHFSEISQPLRELTKDESKFKWDSNCDISFNKLKKCISQKPVLAFPITNREFIVEVDASNEAIGGILTQEQLNGDIKPVAYYSFALSKQQQKWDTFSKEAYALVIALRQWYMYLFGNKFVVKSDHNPLVTLRNKKDPRGKTARWLMELEEFDFDIVHIPGKDNVKADFLSRGMPSKETPLTQLDKIYSVSDENFQRQLREEQTHDVVIKAAIKDLQNGSAVSGGRLKRVKRQLRIENGILTKSGRPVVPRSMYDYIIHEYHVEGDIKSHLGIEKTYEIIKSRFYWPNLFHHIQNHVATCDICQRCKANTEQPKAALVPLILPDRPMEFISIDIAYLEQDPDGYKYILLIGCVFSKFIIAVPLKDQTGPVIAEAICKKWIYVHGSPKYILSDQGSNVDGDTIRDICNSLHIEKRRTSGYHAQCNGFAERSIRNVREILRTALLDKSLPQSFWRSILDSIVFSLNSSPSTSTKCTPYEVVFGRKPVLPMDLYFDTKQTYIRDCSPTEYLKDLKVQLIENISHVSKFLGITRDKMVKQYNKNLKVHDYAIGDKVWLQRKTFRKDENKKLAPRKTGPWTITKLFSNGVNFKIKEDCSEDTKVVHHNRITPVKQVPQTKSFDISEHNRSSSSSEEEVDEDVEEEVGEEERRYPLRYRTQRVVPGAISWDILDAR